MYCMYCMYIHTIHLANLTSITLLVGYDYQTELFSHIGEMIGKHCFRAVIKSPTELCTKFILKAEKNDRETRANSSSPKWSFRYVGACLRFTYVVN